MSIAIFLATSTVNRMISQVEQAGVMPDIEGRIGRSQFFHACYKMSLPALPRIGTADDGTLTVHAPVRGNVSIPWGMGMKYILEAMAEVRLEVEGERLKVQVADLEFDDLRLGDGCSLPPRVLDLIGPFVHGFLFGGLGLDDRQLMDLPPIKVPLSMAMPGAPPLEMKIKAIDVSAAGLTVLVGMEDDSSLPAPLPDPGDWDLTVAVCEGTAEDIAERAMEAIGDIEGKLSFTIPDSRAVADLVLASAETLTTLGRRGLGRRALRSASTVEVNYKACIGRPNLSFGDGERIILCRIPAKVCARADLVIENFKGGVVDRIKAFFRPSLKAEAQVVRTVANSWDIDGDFVLERAEVTVVQKEGSPPKLELSHLDLEMNLPWPLPSEMLEKVAEGMGKDMITARLPDLMAELPLPPEAPFGLRMEKLRVSTCRGRLAVQANLALSLQGDREAVRASIEQRIKAAMPSTLRSAPS